MNDQPEASEQKQVVKRDDSDFIPDGIQEIYTLIHHRTVLESPIDIHIPRTKPLELPKLEWYHIDLPPKKFRHLAKHQVIYSAKWNQERPYIKGGPLMGAYVFSQLHFHWGANNMEGSEHTISGVAQVLEMHVVFFKSCYLTQESALKCKDGIVVIVYMFKLQDEFNEELGVIIDAIKDIRENQMSCRLKNFTLERYINPFTDDYFLYIGSVNTRTCIHYVLWFICRVPMGIAINQMDTFRSIMGMDMLILDKNFREIQPHGDRTVYHVNPSGQRHTTLLVMQKDTDVSKRRMQNTNKYPRSSKEYKNPTGTTI